MKVIDTALPDVKIIEPKVFGDHRGFFMENYNEEMFKEHGLAVNFIQDNHSLSAEAGVIRGLHYQMNPKSQTKLVRVITGAIFDVVVDIRQDSYTYGKWVSVILSEHNHRMLLVPSGFAHGFCTITPNTHVCYKVDNLYAPDLDRGIHYKDPYLNIDWPVVNPIVSEKDEKQPLLKDIQNNFYSMTEV